MTIFSAGPYPNTAATSKSRACRAAGDSRANIIEPQLAYALRRLEMDMQPGWGVGHGLVAVLEINK